MMGASAAAPRLAVIGRGCDPVRARFAEKQWAPRLGVDMDSATSDEELFGKLAKRRFDLFFMVRVPLAQRAHSCREPRRLTAAVQAPGACQRTQLGVYAGHDVVQRVKEMQARLRSALTRTTSVFCVCASADAPAPRQPHIKVVLMDRGVEHGLSAIASALGLPPVGDVARNTADWPFAD